MHKFKNLLYILLWRLNLHAWRQIMFKILDIMHIVVCNTPFIYNAERSFSPLFKRTVWDWELFPGLKQSRSKKTGVILWITAIYSSWPKDLHCCSLHLESADQYKQWPTHFFPNTAECFSLGCNTAVLSQSNNKTRGSALKQLCTETITFPLGKRGIICKL